MKMSPQGKFTLKALFLAVVIVWAFKGLELLKEPLGAYVSDPELAIHVLHVLVNGHYHGRPVARTPD